MNHSLHALSQQKGKSFFALMRSTEALNLAGGLTNERDRLARRQPAWLVLEQCADLAFAAGEVESVRLLADPFDANATPQVVVRQRNFGLFAPYGPLPLYVTEHAMVQSRFERNAAFERFVNLVCAHLAWSHYCAWSALHPVLGYERPRNIFAQRVGQLSNAPQSAAQGQAGGDHAGACRAAFPGLYAARQRPLAPLRRLLAHYFQVPVQVQPRAGRWMNVPNKGWDARCLGQWRVGHRVLDAQLQTHIVVGPLEAEAFLQWKRKSPCVAALIQIANDYSNGHIQPLVTVQIRTRAAMAARIGAMSLGHDAWAHPGESIQTLTVFDSFQEPQ